MQILYKTATALTCNLTIDSVADFDNVTFYRYSASDVNRTKPIRISPDGKMYDLNANTSSLIILAPSKRIALNKEIYKFIIYVDLYIKERTEIESTYFCNSTLVNQTIMFMFQGKSHELKLRLKSSKILKFCFNNGFSASIPLYPRPS